MQFSMRAGARRVLSAAALAGGLAACTPGPDHAAPEIALADRYAVIAPLGPEAGLPWWEGLGDPALTELIARTRTGSVTLAAARARLHEAEAEARRAGVSGLRGDAGVEARSETGVASVQASLSVLPDITGGQARQAEATRARLQAAHFDLAEAERRLLGEVATAYVDFRFFQVSRALRQRDLASRRASLREIAAQVERGAATRLDLLRAEALVAETEADLPRLEAAILRQANRIATLTGQPASALPLSPDRPGAQPLPRSGAPVGVPADLLRLRPDIRAAERRYAAEVSGIGVAQAARWPQLSLSGLVRAPLRGGAGSDTLTAGLVMPVLAQPALAAAQEAQEARATQAYLAWRASVLSAVEEVETALAALSAARQAAGAAGRALRLNEEALALSRQLLEGGGATALDLLERERAVAAARSTLAQLHRDIARDHVALYTALGVAGGFGD